MNNNYLTKLLAYNKETGDFVWIMSPCKNIKPGTVAGRYAGGGYRVIRINKIDYYAHRLAWLYIYDKFPSNELDHINNIKSDNRICNLREVTRQQNQFNMPMQSNNTSGFTGVTYRKSKMAYTAQIYVDRKQIYLGTFGSAEEAYSEYLSAKIKYHSLNAGAA